MIQTVFTRGPLNSPRGDSIVDHDEAVSIRYLYNQGRTADGKYYSMRMIAEMYGISYSTTYHVIRRLGAYRKETNSDNNKGDVDSN